MPLGNNDCRGRMDTTTQALVEALKQGLQQPGEQRLFKSGKLPGLFAGRTGANGDAAAQGLQDGLLEITRTEAKGKAITEWVRVTPRALEFVHLHESPVQALRDLQAVLQLSQQGMPAWVAELRAELQAMADRFTEEAQKITQLIDSLSHRVADALHLAEAAQPRLPEDLAGVIPWAQQALEHLEHRKSAGLTNPCTLPELFIVLRERQPDLTVAEYHAGLRRLQEKSLAKLLPFEGSEPLPEPEYALLDGAATFYYLERLCTTLQGSQNAAQGREAHPG